MRKFPGLTITDLKVNVVTEEILCMKRHNEFLLILKFLRFNP